MEFIEGESLACRIAHGPLPPREAAQIILALLSALEAFHKLGIIHRDLKPSNVLLSGTGTKLLDFGIAKQMSLTPPPQETAATLLDATTPGLFLGTPKYASPEQFRGQPVDARSDLFSLGVIFFEMLTGQPPFPGESFGDIAHSVLYGSPPALSGSPAISAMGRIVHRALEREPRDRYPSAEAMAAELRASLLLRTADEAFQTAFRLNPNLTLAHNLYTQLQVDQGRTLDAMKRLLGRAHQRRSDAELFAGLGHVCRYCGLLQPALAAQKEARRLDPRISLSINHTYFMLGDHQSSLESSGRDFGYATGFALAMLGRTPEAVATLREREQSNPPRLGRLFLTSLRALLEGNRKESLEASDELRQATFRDPEGMYYLALHFSSLSHSDHALEMLSRAIDNGFFCYPAMVRAAWLDPLRGLPEFTALLRKSHQLHLDAYEAFLAAGGDTLLGIRAATY